VGPVQVVWDQEEEEEVEELDLRIEDNQSMNVSSDEPLSSLEMIEDNYNGNNGNNENNLIDI
jgi:hypothetical protein